jgi:hypothetical protein
MDFYPPSRKGSLMMLGAIRLGWFGSPLSAGLIAGKRRTCVGRILVIINLLRMQDEVRNCEDGAFLSRVLKES